MMVGYNCVYSQHMEEFNYYVPTSERVKKVEQPEPLRITVHDHSNFHYSYQYVAFSGGCILGGREVYVSRYSGGHMSPESHDLYGKIGFVTREQNGNFNEAVFPDLDYEHLNAELRDPNISNIDQNNAFRSGFATNNDEETPVYYNYMYVLDKDFEVQSSIVWQDSKHLWGNTLITPD